MNIELDIKDLRNIELALMFLSDQCKRVASRAQEEQNQALHDTYMAIVDDSNETFQKIDKVFCSALENPVSTNMTDVTSKG